MQRKQFVVCVLCLNLLSSHHTIANHSSTKRYQAAGDGVESTEARARRQAMFTVEYLNKIGNRTDLIVLRQVASILNQFGGADGFMESFKADREPLPKGPVLRADTPIRANQLPEHLRAFRHNVATLNEDDWELPKLMSKGAALMGGANNIGGASSFGLALGQGIAQMIAERALDKQGVLGDLQNPAHIFELGAIEDLSKVYIAMEKYPEFQRMLEPYIPKVNSQAVTALDLEQMERIMPNYMAMDRIRDLERRFNADLFRWQFDQVTRGLAEWQVPELQYRSERAKHSVWQGAHEAAAATPEPEPTPGPRAELSSLQRYERNMQTIQAGTGALALLARASGQRENQAGVAIVGAAAATAMAFASLTGGPLGIAVMTILVSLGNQLFDLFGGNDFNAKVLEGLNDLRQMVQENLDQLMNQSEAHALEFSRLKRMVDEKFDWIQRMSNHQNRALHSRFDYQDHVLDELMRAVEKLGHQNMQLSREQENTQLMKALSFLENPLLDAEPGFAFLPSVGELEAEHYPQGRYNESLNEVFHSGAFRARGLASGHAPSGSTPVYLLDSLLKEAGIKLPLSPGLGPLQSRTPGVDPKVWDRPLNFNEWTKAARAFHSVAKHTAASGVPNAQLREVRYCRADPKLNKLAALIEAGQTQKQHLEDLVPIDSEGRPSVHNLMQVLAWYERTVEKVAEAAQHAVVEPFLHADGPLKGYNPFVDIDSDDFQPRPDAILSILTPHGIAPCTHQKGRNPGLTMRMENVSDYARIIPKPVLLARDILGGEIRICYSYTHASNFKAHLQVPDYAHKGKVVEANIHATAGVQIEVQYVPPEFQASGHALPVARYIARDPSTSRAVFRRSIYGPVWSDYDPHKLRSKGATRVDINKKKAEAKQKGNEHRKPEVEAIEKIFKAAEKIQRPRVSSTGDHRHWLMGIYTHEPDFNGLYAEWRQTVFKRWNERPAFERALLENSTNLLPEERVQESLSAIRAALKQRLESESRAQENRMRQAVRNQTGAVEQALREAERARTAVKTLISLVYGDAVEHHSGLQKALDGLVGEPQLRQWVLAAGAAPSDSLHGPALRGLIQILTDSTEAQRLKPRRYDVESALSDLEALYLFRAQQLGCDPAGQLAHWQSASKGQKWPAWVHAEINSAIRAMTHPQTGRLKMQQVQALVSRATREVKEPWEPGSLANRLSQLHRGALNQSEGSLAGPPARRSVSDAGG